MFRRKLLIAGLLPLLAIPLMGDSCTEEKVIFLAVGVDTTAGFIASGETNIFLDEETIDVKENLDLAANLDDAGVDPEDIQEIKVSRVFYRVTVPEPGRVITDGTVTVDRNGDTGTSEVLIDNFAGDAGAVTDWIDITEKLGSGAVTLLNTFLAECLNELKTGTPVTNTSFTYEVSGTSNPVGDATNFEWELKVSFLVKAEETLDLPNF
jgi:hypothetical protein